MKDQRLAHIVQRRQTRHTCLSKNAVCQAHKALHFYIHNPLMFTDINNLFLSLHRCLLRHDHQKGFVLFRLCPLYNGMIHKIRFSPSGTSQYEINCHFMPPIPVFLKNIILNPL